MSGGFFALSGCLEDLAFESENDSFPVGKGGRVQQAASGISAHQLGWNLVFRARGAIYKWGIVILASARLGAQQNVSRKS
jgi:hypothetical protein